MLCVHNGSSSLSLRVSLSVKPILLLLDTQVYFTNLLYLLVVINSQPLLVLFLLFIGGLSPLRCLGRRTCAEYILLRVPWGHHLMSVATFVTYWLLDRHGVTHPVLLPPPGCLGKRTCVESTSFRVPWGHLLMSIVLYKVPG